MECIGSFIGKELHVVLYRFAALLSTFFFLIMDIYVLLPERNACQKWESVIYWSYDVTEHLNSLSNIYSHFKLQISSITAIKKMSDSIKTINHFSPFQTCVDLELSGLLILDELESSSHSFLVF